MENESFDFFVINLFNESKIDLFGLKLSIYIFIVLIYSSLFFILSHLSYSVSLFFLVLLITRI